MFCRKCCEKEGEHHHESINLATVSHFKFADWTRSILAVVWFCCPRQLRFANKSLQKWFVNNPDTFSLQGITNCCAGKSNSNRPICPRMCLWSSTDCCRERKGETPRRETKSMPIIGVRGADFIPFVPAVISTTLLTKSDRFRILNHSAWLLWGSRQRSST